MPRHASATPKQEDAPHSPHVAVPTMKNWSPRRYVPDGCDRKKETRNDTRASNHRRNVGMKNVPCIQGGASQQQQQQKKKKKTPPTKTIQKKKGGGRTTSPPFVPCQGQCTCRYGRMDFSKPSSRNVNERKQSNRSIVCFVRSSPVQERVVENNG